MHSVAFWGMIFVLVKIPVFAFFRLYSLTWKYAGAHELVDVLKATIVSQVIVVIIVYFLNPFGVFKGLPRSVGLIDFILTATLIASFRLSKRLYFHLMRQSFSGGRNTLIVGAGAAGEMIVRDMRRHEVHPYRPVGLVDDDEAKVGNYVQGIKVLGSTEQIYELVDDHKIETIMIAIPSANTRQVRDIMSHARKARVRDVKILPGVKSLLEGNVALSDVKEIDIEDILGRQQVSGDGKDVKGFIEGKVILVTGAGGSIGSEIVRQAVANDPKLVVMLDIDETEIFYLNNEIRQRYQGAPIVPVVADVCDTVKLNNIFSRHRPEIVLHAAAYKHVPMMELYPEEALRVNIFGTKNVIDASIDTGVKRFVMISSDKAVNPTSVMGATKRVAEEIAKFYNKEAGKRQEAATRFISVRFGNVVGSRGSVIPIFKAQISKGGPVTVTHKDMRRYFMSIPEAVALVLQAGAMGEGGEVFVLDMGDQVRILDVAREMVRLHGLEPDKDVPIVFTGIREGEKLYEELTTAMESVEPTSHPKIRKNRDESVEEDILESIQRFREMIARPDKRRIVAALKEIIPTYKAD